MAMKKLLLNVEVKLTGNGLEDSNPVRSERLLNDLNNALSEVQDAYILHQIVHEDLNVYDNIMYFVLLVSPR